jgi:hypothetical protein
MLVLLSDKSIAALIVGSCPLPMTYADVMRPTFTDVPRLFSIFGDLCPSPLLIDSLRPGEWPVALGQTSSMGVDQDVHATS